MNPASIRSKMELRVLAPAAGIALAGIPVAVGFANANPNNSWDAPAAALARVCACQIFLFHFMAVEVFGREFADSTMERLLSQPVPRSRIWAEKTATLAGMIAIVLLADLACATRIFGRSLDRDEGIQRANSWMEQSTTEQARATIARTLPDDSIGWSSISFWGGLHVATGGDSAKVERFRGRAAPSWHWGSQNVVDYLNFAMGLALLGGIAALGGGPLAALTLRRSGPAFWVSWLAPFALLVVGITAALNPPPRRFLQSAADAYPFGEGGLVVSSIVAFVLAWAVATTLLARRKFLRLEV